MKHYTIHTAASQGTTKASQSRGDDEGNAQWRRERRSSAGSSCSMVSQRSLHDDAAGRNFSFPRNLEDAGGSDDDDVFGHLLSGFREAPHVFNRHPRRANASPAAGSASPIEGDEDDTFARSYRSASAMSALGAANTTVVESRPHMASVAGGLGPSTSAGQGNHHAPPSAALRAQPRVASAAAAGSRIPPTFLTEQSRPSSSTSSINRALARTPVFGKPPALRPTRSSMQPSPLPQSPALGRTATPSALSTSAGSFASAVRLPGDHHSPVSQSTATQQGSPPKNEALEDVEATLSYYRSTLHDTLRIVQERTECLHKLSACGVAGLLQDGAAGGEEGASLAGGAGGRAGHRRARAAHANVGGTPSASLTSFPTSQAPGDAACLRSLQQSSHGAEIMALLAKTKPTAGGHTSDDATEAADRALHLLLSSKFSPINVSCPVLSDSLVAAPHDGASGGPVGQLQLAKTMSQLSNTISMRTSAARRERRNCFGKAIDVIRESKALHERLKDHVKLIEEERRRKEESLYACAKSGDDDGSLSGTSNDDTKAEGRRHQQRRIFIRENRVIAANPSEWKRVTQMHRKEATERGMLARYLHESMLNTYTQTLEEQLSNPDLPPRGADKSRDRKWLGILSFLFSTRAVWQCFESAQEAVAAQASAEAEAVLRERSKSFCADPLARSLEKQHKHYHMKHRRKLEEHELDRVAPLMEALRKTSFALRLKFRTILTRIDATRKARVVLQAAASVLLIKTRMSLLRRNIRAIQRTTRIFLKSLRVRDAFTALQFDVMVTERLFYSRPVCQETKDFEKKKRVAQQKEKQRSQFQALHTTQSSQNLLATTTAAPASPNVTEDAAAATNGGAARRPSTAADVSEATRRESASETTSQMKRIASRRRLDDALEHTKSGTVSTTVVSVLLPAPQESESTSNWRAALRVGIAVAQPLMAQIAHRNGKYGPDPTNARLVALETHAFYASGGARIPPRMRERILDLIKWREHHLFIEKRKRWKVLMAEARHNHTWLVELSDVQKHMRRSPAQEELNSFAWPKYPTRRCLLTANEMRLVVLAAFAWLSDDNAGGGGGFPPPPSSTTAVSEAPTAAPNVVGSRVGSVSAEDLHKLSTLLTQYQSQLQLPDVTPGFLSGSLLTATA